MIRIRDGLSGDEIMQILGVGLRRDDTDWECLVGVGFYFLVGIALIGLWMGWNEMVWIIRWVGIGWNNTESFCMWVPLGWNYMDCGFWVELGWDAMNCWGWVGTRCYELLGWVELEWDAMNCWGLVDTRCYELFGLGWVGMRLYGFVKFTIPPHLPSSINSLS